MRSRVTRHTAVRVTALMVAAGVLAACATTPSATASGTTDSCPADPVKVVVSVDQWSDLVTQLGGACAQVTTVLQSAAVDPHDYEPTPGDAAKMVGAQLVVLNGAGYDTWASKLVATLSPAPAVVDAGTVVGVSPGANPHLWYSPTYVASMATAVTAALQQLAPAAKHQFIAAAGAWAAAMKPYDAAVASVRATAKGRTYGATEGIFDYMAQALGLTDLTPQGWRNAAANDSDPAPGDIAAFQSALSGRAMDLLVYNTQTEGSAPDSIRSAAQAAGVPVVDVTETMPDGQTSFVAWQVGQLRQVAAALAS